MNAVSKVGSSSIAWRVTFPKIATINLVAALLLVLSIISAFSVIYCRDMSRQMVSEVQSLQYESSKLVLAHNQLLVEQSSLSTDQRVAIIAENNLGMKIPAAKSVVMVRT